MPTLITREELEHILDEDITPERFESLYRIGIRVVSSGYRGNPEEAVGQTAEVIAGVLFGVVVRIASNPKGTRQLNAGGAGLTFGGTDDTIAKVFTLTDEELDRLAEVSPEPPRAAGAFTIRPWAV